MNQTPKYTFWRQKKAYADNYVIARTDAMAMNFVNSASNISCLAAATAPTHPSWILDSSCRIITTEIQKVKSEDPLVG